MKAIKIKQIEIEGFKSIIDLSLDLDKPGLHIIRGKNGRGKTTIIESIYWALYGDLLKGSTSPVTWPEVRPKNYKGVKVVLLLEIDDTEYLVVRTKSYKGKILDQSFKPDSLLIWRGTDMITIKDKLDNQAYLIQLLGVDSSLFLSSILFGQSLNRLARFSPADKRAFFDAIFELDYIDDAKSLCQLELENEVLPIIAEQDTLINTSRNTIKNKEELISTITSNIKLFKDQQTADLQRAEDYIITLLKAKDELAVKIKQKQEAKSTRPVVEFDENIYLQLTKESPEPVLKQLQAKRNLLLQDLEQKSDTCPVCKQKIKDADKYKKHIQDQLKELEKPIQDQESAVEIYLHKLKKLLDQRQKYLEEQKIKTSIDQEIAVLQSHISRADPAIDKARTDLQLIKDREAPDTKQLDKVEKEIKDLHKLIKQAEAVKADLLPKAEALNFWIKTGFGANGFKNYLFNEYLNRLNKIMMDYTDLGIQIRCYLDLEGSRKIFKIDIVKDGITCDYSELSGGEKARVDVILGLSINEYLPIECNVLFLDEFFEGMDEVGINLIFDILKTKIKNKSIYIITHSNYLGITGVTFLDVEKTEGKSYLN